MAIGGLCAFAMIFLKPIVEKIVVFIGEMWAKLAEERFHRKRAHIIFSPEGTLQSR